VARVVRSQSATKSQVDTASVADLQQLDDDIPMQEMTSSAPAAAAAASAPVRQVEAGSSDGLGAGRRYEGGGIALADSSLAVPFDGSNGAPADGVGVVENGVSLSADGPGAEASAGAGAYEEDRASQRRVHRTTSSATHHSHASAHSGGGGHDGGHKPPPWSRRKALFILIGSTVLFALLAEILVNSVDTVLHGSPITEKFIGVTLFAIVRAPRPRSRQTGAGAHVVASMCVSLQVPSLTEYVNAILFAMRNNIALRCGGRVWGGGGWVGRTAVGGWVVGLTRMGRAGGSMEISSQYTVQVTLLQLPILVMFSFVYNEFLTVPITYQNSIMCVSCAPCAHTHSPGAVLTPAPAARRAA
jgi:hypothetical protein